MDRPLANMYLIPFSFSVLIQAIPKWGSKKKKWRIAEEHPEKKGGKGPSPALTPMRKAATEKGEDRVVQREGVQPETEEWKSQTETENGGGATAETGKEKETKTKA